jgi:hypothetical protein
MLLTFHGLTQIIGDRRNLEKNYWSISSRTIRPFSCERMRAVRREQRDVRFITEPLRAYVVEISFSPSFERQLRRACQPTISSRNTKYQLKQSLGSSARRVYPAPIGGITRDFVANEENDIA